MDQNLNPAEVMADFEKVAETLRKYDPRAARSIMAYIGLMRMLLKIGEVIKGDDGDIQRRAEECAYGLLDPAPDDPERITAEWLMEKHPNELRDLDEAEVYREFCRSHTITWKGCYGDGSIMWPMWMELKRSIAAL